MRERSLYNGRGKERAKGGSKREGGKERETEQHGETRRASEQRARECERDRVRVREKGHRRETRGRERYYTCENTASTCVQKLRHFLSSIPSRSARLAHDAPTIACIHTKRHIALAHAHRTLPPRYHRILSHSCSPTAEDVHGRGYYNTAAVRGLEKWVCCRQVLVGQRGRKNRPVTVRR